MVLRPRTAEGAARRPGHGRHTPVNERDPMNDDIEKTLEEIEAMFAQTARELTTDGDKVTFYGLSPSTLYFSDRPQRVVGHLTHQAVRRRVGRGREQLR